MPNVIHRNAQISPDGMYRWRLERLVDTGALTALWLGVNPSTADASIDDQSIRKLYGFGERLNVQRWLVGNPFAFRATRINELREALDPVGPFNDLFLREMIRSADLVIAGWGRIDKVPAGLRGRFDEVIEMVQAYGKVPYCWGTCDDGSPRHPLMLSYDTPLEVWGR